MKAKGDEHNQFRWRTCRFNNTGIHVGTSHYTYRVHYVAFVAPYKFSFFSSLLEKRQFFDPLGYQTLQQLFEKKKKEHKKKQKKKAKEQPGSTEIFFLLAVRIRLDGTNPWKLAPRGTQVGLQKKIYVHVGTWYQGDNRTMVRKV